MSRFSNLLHPPSLKTSGKSTPESSKQNPAKATDTVHQQYYFSQPRFSAVPPKTSVLSSTLSKIGASQSANKRYENQSSKDQQALQKLRRPTVPQTIGTRSVSNPDGPTLSQGYFFSSPKKAFDIAGLLGMNTNHQAATKASTSSLHQLLSQHPKQQDKSEAQSYQMMHSVPKRSEAEAMATTVGQEEEEILDEGDMLQSHGMSPPRFSMVTNNFQKGASGGSIFGSSRHSEAVISRPQSKVISPSQHDEKNSHDAEFLYHSSSGFPAPSQRISKPSPVKLHLQQCKNSLSGYNTVAGNIRQQKLPQQFTIDDSTNNKKQNQKSMGFSGDLLNVDSPRSNGSAVNGGLSKRMACLTNTQKQFIKRVDFDQNLKETFAIKQLDNTSEVTPGYDDSHLHSLQSERKIATRQVANDSSQHMPESAEGAKKLPPVSFGALVQPKTPRILHQNDDLIIVKTQESQDKQSVFDTNCGRVVRTEVYEEGVESSDEDKNKISVPSEIHHARSNIDARKPPKQRQHRPSLDQQFTTTSGQPNLLFDYMQGKRNYHKQRTYSNNDELLLLQNGPHRLILDSKAEGDKANLQTVTDQSNINGKMSETSHEVWNAGQSSHQNGINSPGSTHSAYRLRSAAYSHVMSPNGEEDTPKHHRENLFGSKASIGETGSHIAVQMRPVLVANPRRKKSDTGSNLKVSSSISKEQVTFEKVEEEQLLSVRTNSKEVLRSPETTDQQVSKFDKQDDGFKLNLVDITVKPLASFTSSTRQQSSSKKSQNSLYEDKPSNSVTKSQQNLNHISSSKESLRQKDHLYKSPPGYASQLAYGTGSKLTSKRNSSNPSLLTSGKPPKGISPEYRQLMARKNSKLQSGNNSTTASKPSKNTNPTSQGPQSKNPKVANTFTKARTSVPSRIKTLRKPVQQAQHPTKSEEGHSIRSSFNSCNKKAVGITLASNMGAKKYNLPITASYGKNTPSLKSQSVKQLSSTQKAANSAAKITKPAAPQLQQNRVTGGKNSKKIQLKTGIKNFHEKSPKAFSSPSSRNYNSNMLKKFNSTFQLRSMNTTTLMNSQAYASSKLGSQTGMKLPKLTGFLQFNQTGAKMTKQGHSASKHLTTIKKPKDSQSTLDNLHREAMQFTLSSPPKHVDNTNVFGNERQDEENNDECVQFQTFGNEEQSSNSPHKSSEMIQIATGHEESPGRAEMMIYGQEKLVTMFDDQKMSQFNQPTTLHSESQEENSIILHASGPLLSVEKDSQDQALLSGTVRTSSNPQQLFSQPTKQESFWSSENTARVANTEADPKAINILSEAALKSPEHRDRTHGTQHFERSPDFGQESSCMDTQVYSMVGVPANLIVGQRGHSGELSSMYLSRDKDQVGWTDVQSEDHMTSKIHQDQHRKIDLSDNNDRCQVAFSSRQSSQRRDEQSNREEQDKQQKASFTTRYGSTPGEQRQQSRMFPNAPQLESSVVSRLSQNNNQPIFAQIDHNDQTLDFISGVEKFTQEIQDFIVTKDEQMQNLIHDRKCQYKTTIQMLEDRSYSRQKSNRSPLISIEKSSESKNIAVLEQAYKSGGPRELSPRPLHHQHHLDNNSNQGLQTERIIVPKGVDTPKNGTLTVERQSSVGLNKPLSGLGLRTSSDHTFLSADGARVSFVTAKQTEAEILEYERLRKLKIDNDDNEDEKTQLHLNKSGKRTTVHKSTLHSKKMLFMEDDNAVTPKMARSPRLHQSMSVLVTVNETLPLQLEQIDSSADNHDKQVSSSSQDFYKQSASETSLTNNDRQLEIKQSQDGPEQMRE